MIIQSFELKQCKGVKLARYRYQQVKWQLIYTIYWDGGESRCSLYSSILVILKKVLQMKPFILP